MNGERYRGTSLPFKPSMRRTDAAVDCNNQVTRFIVVGLTEQEAKILNCFKGWQGEDDQFHRAQLGSIISITI